MAPVYVACFFLFKSTSNCHQSYACKQVILTAPYSRFEINLFELGFVFPVLCFVIYRPPNLTILTSMCCLEKTLAKNFVSDTTQKCRYTLVLAHSFTVLNLEGCDALFLNHMPVVLDMPLLCHVVKIGTPGQYHRVINSSAASQFSNARTHNLVISPIDFSCFDSDVEVLSSRFNTACQTALGTVCSLKTRHSKPQHEPLLNDALGAARHNCRRAKHKWKKDKLKVSFQMLRHGWRC